MFVFVEYNIYDDFFRKWFLVRLNINIYFTPKQEQFPTMEAPCTYHTLSWGFKKDKTSEF